MIHEATGNSKHSVWVVQVVTESYSQYPALWDTQAQLMHCPHAGPRSPMSESGDSCYYQASISGGRPPAKLMAQPCLPCHHKRLLKPFGVLLLTAGHTCFLSQGISAWHCHTAWYFQMGKLQGSPQLCSSFTHMYMHKEEASWQTQMYLKLFSH